MDDSFYLFAPSRRRGQFPELPLRMRAAILGQISRIRTCCKIASAAAERQLPALSLPRKTPHFDICALQQMLARRGGTPRRRVTPPPKKNPRAEARGLFLQEAGFSPLSLRNCAGSADAD
jgi:hypothetical protein